MLTVFAAAALLAGGGCKKKEHDRMGQGAEAPSTTETQTQARRGTDLDRTPGTQARSRATYANEMHERLNKIDAKINELNQNPDPAKKDLAIKAKAQRDAVQQKLDMSRDITSDRWDDYKKNVDESMKKLDDELDIK
jgi:hypothetical protein